MLQKQTTKIKRSSVEIGRWDFCRVYSAKSIDKDGTHRPCGAIVYLLNDSIPFVMSRGYIEHVFIF